MLCVRFVAQDELPLLARGIQDCYAEEAQTSEQVLAGLRRDVAELDIWWGGCLVALEDQQPVGVLVGARRDKSLLIQRLGVLPRCKGQGLEQRMLGLLTEKMRAEGVERLIAEVPQGALEHVFEQAGFEPHAEYQDLEQILPLSTLRAPAAVHDYSVEELLAYPGLWHGESHAWARSYRTLHARRGSLQGSGLSTGGRLIAALIHGKDERHEHHNLWRFGRLSGDHGLATLSLLVRVVLAGLNGPVRIPRMYSGEVPIELVAGWGFAPVRTFLRYRQFLQPPKGADI